MPLVVKDRVRETTTTLGTGTITLAGAVAGFQSFSAIGNGNTTYYTINLPGANEWEVGIGTYTASGTTLSRDTILASSNGGSAVNFSAGTKDVFCTYPAGRSVYYDTATNVTLNALTLSGGTANGVVYLNASKVATTGSALTFDGTNLALTTTGAIYKVPNAGGSIFDTGGNNGIYIQGTPSALMGFYTGGSERARITDIGTLNIVGAGTAGSTQAISFNGSTPVDTLVTTSGGLVGIGTNAPGAKLEVFNSAVNGAFVPNTLSTWRVAQIRNDQSVTSGSAAGIAFVGKSDTQPAGIVAINGNTTGGVVGLGFLTVAGNTTSESMRLDSSGNLGLGVTPKTDWATDYKAMQFGASGALSSHTSTSLNFTVLATNQYVNNAGTSKFINDGYAPRYLLRGDTGEHYWYTTNTSTAGQNVTNTQAMTLDANGSLVVGGTTVVTNNGGVTATTTASGSIATSFAMRNAGTANGSGSYLNFRGVSNTGAEHDYCYLAMVADDTTAKTGSIRFSTTAGSSPVERARISSDGTFRVKGAGTAGSTDAVQFSGSAPASSLLLDASGNLGLGVTPSAWYTSGSTVAQVRQASFYAVDNIALEIGNNAFLTSGGSTWNYINTGFATRYNSSSGKHLWYTAPSGTANDPITFTQAMTLDASGNLGIVTTSPSSFDAAARTLVVGTTSGNNGITIAAGSTGASTINFADGTTGGAQYAGYIDYQHNGDYMRFGTNGGTERARITSGGDFRVKGAGTAGSTDAFQVSGSAPADAARITSDGNFFVGTTALLADTNYFASSPGNAWSVFGHVNGTASGVEYVKFYYNNGQIGSISQNGTTAVAYNTSSDYRLKDNPQPLTNSGAFIDALQPKTWNWKADGTKGVGFIAHEVQEVSPGTVVGAKDAVDADGKPVMQAMEYGSAEFIANIVAELQSLRARVAQLEQGA